MHQPPGAFIAPSKIFLENHPNWRIPNRGFFDSVRRKKNAPNSDKDDSVMLLIFIPFDGPKAHEDSAQARSRACYKTLLGPSFSAACKAQYFIGLIRHE
jgi:hypothetical protein